MLNYLLGYPNLKVYQDDSMFKFSIDSVLLPNFVTLSKKKGKVLDIGCGNAVIPIVLTTRTSNHIDGVEIQKDVYELGKKSVEYNKLEDQITIYNEDIKEFSKNSETDIYDTITCNPPYFKDMVTNSDIHKTYARHEMSLSVEDVMAIAKKLLKNNGNIAIVHRTERLIDIISAMKSNNIEPKKIQFVYSKENSPSNILLIEGTKNGKPGVKIMEPLYLHNSDHTYTEQLKKYLNNYI